jgi:divalent metal cation (Fe/Co/Zn/Cd) transporter
MRKARPFGYPHEIEGSLRTAKTLSWVSIVYMLSVVVLMYLVMGSSQAMKSAWVEDLLTLIPPAAFLIAHRVQFWKPNDVFPYGYLRAVNIAFLLAAFSLLAVGVLLVIDGAEVLFSGHHPSIGAAQVFGRTIWLGWLMIPVLLWSMIPAYFLGRKKKKVAAEIHDKTLYADADMNSADWRTGGAAIFGILGIGIGWWWADAAAALFISVSVLHDGYANLKEVIGDLCDRRPQKVNHRPWMELEVEIIQRLQALDWVGAVEVRLREHGHVVMGEAFITPANRDYDEKSVLEATCLLEEIDWRLHEIVLTLVPSKQG